MNAQYPNAPVDPTALIEGEEIGVGIFMMSPDAAGAWLRGFNVHNRPLQKSHADSLARDIAEGRWRLTHQGIAIDRQLRLMDGQHRLAGIASGDRAVPVQVTWNLDPDVFPVIDTGKRRTAADALSLSDVAITRNRVLVASVAKFLLGRHALSMAQFSNERLALTNEEIIETVLTLGEESIDRAVSVGQRMTAGLNGTVVSAFMYETGRAGIPEEVVIEDFLTPIWKGIGLTSEADPRYAAQAYFARAKKGGVTDRRRAQMFTVLCQAWNTWARQGERRLFRDPTEFVEIDGLADGHPALASRGLQVAS